MTRTILFTVLLASFAATAFAGTAPVKNRQSPETVADSCLVLGDGGESVEGGCINRETGAAVSCDGNGTCTDYFADPRWKKIRLILDGARRQQTPL